MARLALNNVSSFGQTNPITFSSSTTATGSWPSAPPFPTIASPDYAPVIVEPDTPNEEITYLTAYVAGQTSGTFSRAAETSTGGMPAGSGTIHAGTPWVHGPTAADFFYPNRQSSSHTTVNLPANGQEQSTITLARSYRLLSIVVIAAARVRLYDRVVKQVADANRAIGQRPRGDHGLMFEFVSTPTLLSADVSPPAIASSMEVVPTSSIPITIDNRTTGSAVITVTFTFLVLE